jgi:hypothetical protein
MRSKTLQTSTAAAAGCLTLAAALWIVPATSTHATWQPLPDPAPARPPAADRNGLAQAANVALGLTASDVRPLDVTLRPGEGGVVEVPLAGEVARLEFWPHSLRSEEFILRAQIHDGSWIDVDPGPVRTLRGEVEGVPGSVVGGSLLDDGLHATVLLPDGKQYWVQPAHGVVPGAAANDYVIYDDADVLGAEGACGVTDAWLADKDLLIDQLDDGGPADGGIAGGSFFCTELACDADFEYFQDYGTVTNTQNRIELVINTVNLQYANQVQIVHVISAILVRTSEPDPYSSTSPGTLLNQFRNEWLNNQGSIQRDVAHLFTGKNINGGVIGIAYTIGGICTSSAYCLSQSDCCGSLACAADLTAHELGHLWGGFHCDPCNETMRSFIGCFNNFTTPSINSIVAHRNSRNCLDACDGLEQGVTGLPFLDDFPSTTINPDLWTGIDGATANINGINEPSGAFSLNIQSSDEVRTAMMDAANAVRVTLSYWYQRTGGGNSPETGEDLIIEYRTNDFQWAEANSHPGSGPDMTTYEFVSLELPANAFHGGLRIRIRGTSPNANSDDWFVDDVGVDVIDAPTNDLCTTATLIQAGDTTFSNIGAASDGPDETPGGCGSVESDVWFKYVNLCNGVVTVSVCDADFDTQLAVYAACPGGPDEFIACNDDDCGTGSTLTFNGLESTLYRIRVGGAGGDEGIATISVDCQPGVACPGDCGTQDGTVDIQDLLSLLAQWGGAGSCDLAPAGGDGSIDINDLLELLASWGPCQ